MNIFKLNYLRIKKCFKTICFKLSGADYPFEMASCRKEEFKGENFPEDMGKLLAHFDYEDEHYVIYIKK